MPQHPIYNASLLCFTHWGLEEASYLVWEWPDVDMHRRELTLKHTKEWRKPDPSYDP